MKLNKIYIHTYAKKQLYKSKEHYEKFIRFVKNFDFIKKSFGKDIKYIKRGLYRGKLDYSKRVIFSLDINQDHYNLLIFRIGNHEIYDKPDLESYTYEKWEKMDFAKNENKYDNNQFLELNYNEVDYDFVSKIKFDDYYFRLDNDQREFFTDFFDENSSYKLMGQPGTGKTLLLNKVAFEVLKNKIENNGNLDFIYITYNEKLKENFKSYLENMFKEESKKNVVDKISLDNFDFDIYTFEEFVFDYIVNNLNKNLEDGEKIDKELYLRTENILDIITTITKNNNNKKYNKFYSYELIRIINSVLWDIKSNDLKDKEKIVKSLKRANDKKQINVLDESYDVLESIFDRISKLKTKNKLLLTDLIDEINKKKKDDYDYIKKNLLLIDEAQDFTNRELTFIFDLWGKKQEYLKQLLVAFDKKQNISMHGNPDKGLDNLFKKVDSKKLVNNYRNSYFIKKFANYFLKNDDLDYSNLSDIKIKILFKDKNEFINNDIFDLLRKNRNFGIIAMGDTYNKIKDLMIENDKEYFLDNLYNEEEAKGIEFTNLIIANFMEPNNNRSLEYIDFKKWYVSITRAKYNLLINFNSEKEFEVLKSKIREFFNKDLDNDKDILLIGKEQKIVRQFENDLLEEDYSEGVLKEVDNAKELLMKFEKNNDIRLLEKAKGIYYKYDLYEDFLQELKSIDNDYKNKLIVELLLIINKDSNDKIDYLEDFEMYFKKLEKNEIKTIVNEFIENSKNFKLLKNIMNKDYEVFNHIVTCELKYRNVNKMDYLDLFNDIEFVIKNVEDVEEILINTYIELLIKKENYNKAIKFLFNRKEYERIIEIYEEKKNSIGKDKNTILNIFRSYIINRNSDEIFKTFKSLIKTKLGRKYSKNSWLKNEVSNYSQQKTDEIQFLIDKETGDILTGKEIIEMMNSSKKNKKQKNKKIKNFKKKKTLNIVENTKSNEANKYFKGLGTETNPYKIETVEQLLNINYFLSENFILCNDLDLKGVSWIPIGQEMRHLEKLFSNITDLDLSKVRTSPFIGIFDGNNHVIKNLSLNDQLIELSGLFGFISSKAILKNLKVINSKISSISFTGGICAKNYGLIKNCYFEGDIIGKENGIGGISSQNFGKIHNCKIDINITAKDFIGGISGVNYGEIKNCESKNTIIGTNNLGGISGINKGSISHCKSFSDIEGISIIGGIVGQNEKTLEENESISKIIGKHRIGGNVGQNLSESLIIKSNSNSIIKNKVDIRNDEKIGFGSFIGLNQGTIDRCNSVGEVYGNNFSGGFAGGNYYNSLIKNSYFKGKVTGNDNVGGFCGVNFGEISQSYDESEASGKKFVGGFLGFNEKEVIDCYSYSRVSGKEKVGFFVGENYNDSVVKNCYSINPFIQTNDYSFAGNNIGKIINCYPKSDSFLNFSKSDFIDFINSNEIYKKWDFNEVWNIEKGKTLPYLKMQRKNEHNLISNQLKDIEDNNGNNFRCGDQINYNFNEVNIKGRYMSNMRFPFGYIDDKIFEAKEFVISENLVSYDLWYKVLIYSLKNDYVIQNFGNEGMIFKEDDRLINYIEDYEEMLKPIEKDDLPVTNINWYDAIVWTNALNEMIGLEPIYYDQKDKVIRSSRYSDINRLTEIDIKNKNGFRLMNSYEWEVAAKFIGKKEEFKKSSKYLENDGYYWLKSDYVSGPKCLYSDAKELEKSIWFINNSMDEVKPINKMPPNNLGVYDMAGNIFEWCNDSLVTNYGKAKIIRGGSFSSPEDHLKVGRTFIAQDIQTDENIGIRLVKNMYLEE